MATIHAAGPVPVEVLNFMRGKVGAPSFSYLDIWGIEHANTFTVAKAMQLDVLSTIRKAVEVAIEQGVPYQQFQRELTPLLQKLGWWGKADIVDEPTGEIIEGAQLGSPRRLKTIYNVNTRQARAAGSWQRAQETKEDLPYILYLLGPSENHRQEHQSWQGIILRVDDPWWDTHYPTNGFGCKCWTRQITAEERTTLLANGLPLSDGTTASVTEKAPPIVTRPFLNKRTGETVQVPVGIDPGFAHNAGKTRQDNLKQLLDQKLADAPPNVRAAAEFDLAEYQRVNAA